MTEPEKAKQAATVEASSPTVDAPEEDGADTPMLAVWITLAAILFAGVYGLYLGATAKQKQQGAATSALDLPAQSHVASAAAGWTIIGRPS